MPKVEHIKRSHGQSEYVITLTEDEMQEFVDGLDRIAFNETPDSVYRIWPMVANALDLLDHTRFPTPFN